MNPRARRPPADEGEGAVEDEAPRPNRGATAGPRTDEPSLRVQVASIAAIIVVAVIAHAWWINRYRLGFGISEDEARLLGETERFRGAWFSQGPIGVARVWKAPSDMAPAMSVLSAPFLRPSWPPQTTVFVQLPFLALLLASVADIARRLAGFRAALVTTVVVATLPGVVWWSRVFEVIVPGAALWAATFAALVASDALSRRGWTIAAGAAFGVALVTRSMLIGFIPVLVVALVLQQIARRTPLRTMAVRGARFAVPAALIAATRWLFAGSSMFDYLIRQGSGDPQSLGQVHDEWLLLLRVLGSPAAWLIAGSSVAGAVALLASRPTRSDVRRLLGSDRALLLWTALGSFAVLCVVQEDFPGFELIVVVLLVPLALSWSWRGASRWLLAPVAVVVLLQTSLFLSPRASWYQQFFLDSGISVPGDRTLPDSFRSWEPITIAITDTFDELAPDPSAPVVVASDLPILRGAGLRLADSWDADGVGYTDIPSAPTGRAAQDALLRGVPGAVTVGGSERVRSVEAMLADHGFRVLEERPLPTGQRARIWVAPR